MDGLQRSETSFRRQGSSGLVWDDKSIGGLRDKDKNENQQENERQGSIATLERSRSTGARPYRTVNVAPSSKDPPSPKVATCGFCGFFGKPVAAKSKKRR
ncbi:uncharacterized protein At1g15400 [Gastrolobium bilobum]|uniref:uncharacterized protein At1g15400 n=1 Tax=Gastrolobium bilobum TaxID=150636 RepID=UPI002AB05772|nr:uncharacterized protein At1g15400 [Gastrolobium bilobum]